MDNVVQFPPDGGVATPQHVAATGRRRLFASGVIRRGTDGRASVRRLVDGRVTTTRVIAYLPDGPRAA